MGLGKRTGWPFRDLDPKSWLYPPGHAFFTAWLDLGEILLEFFFVGKFSLKTFDVIIQGQTLYWT